MDTNRNALVSSLLAYGAAGRGAEKMNALQEYGNRVNTRLADLLADPVGVLAVSLRQALGADQQERALAWRGYGNPSLALDAMTGSDQTSQSVQQAANEAALNTVMALQTGGSAKGLFDQQPWYHGTATNTGDAISAFDKTKLGSVTGTPAAKRAVFLTRSPDDAASFAELAHERTGGSPYVMDVLFRPNKTATISGADIQSQTHLAQTLDMAREQGLEALMIKGFRDSAKQHSEPTDVLAVLNEALLRSPRAKFAKKDLDKSGLMLGVGAVPVALDRPKN